MRSRVMGMIDRVGVSIRTGRVVADQAQSRLWRQEEISIHPRQILRDWAPNCSRPVDLLPASVATLGGCFGAVWWSSVFGGTAVWMAFVAVGAGAVRRTGLGPRRSALSGCCRSRPMFAGGRGGVVPRMVVASPETATATKAVAFEKYHGIGNDFILVDNRHSQELVMDAAAAARFCDRHFGVGGDGVIFLLPPKQADSDYTMRIYNSDGSEPEMCGNGIRCLARFAHKLDGGKKSVYRIDTLAGVIVPEIVGESVRVDMGEPELRPAQIPTTLQPSDSTRSAQYTVDGREWQVTPVGTGNPHAIVFVSREEFAALDGKLESVGPLFENHASFPERTNTEFLYVVDPKTIDFLVWERGAGRTLACGTGACAATVASVLTGRTSRDVTVNLPGGKLQVEWNEESNHMFMTGPAEFVFAGTWSIA